MCICIDNLSLPFWKLFVQPFWKRKIIINEKSKTKIFFTQMRLIDSASFSITDFIACEKQKIYCIANWISYSLLFFFFISILYTRSSQLTWDLRRAPSTSLIILSFMKIYLFFFPFGVGAIIQSIKANRWASLWQAGSAMTHFDLISKNLHPSCELLWMRTEMIAP